LIGDCGDYVAIGKTPNDEQMLSMADGQNKTTLLDRFKKEIKFYQSVLYDPRTPKLSKFFLGMAVGYALNPIDLIPDFIPILGYLDDLIIVPGLIFIAVKLIPKKLLQEYRNVN
jgi:uncharacterized membrane protein YkvA (DUF1232 family)